MRHFVSDNVSDNIDNYGEIAKCPIICMTKSNDDIANEV